MAMEAIKVITGIGTPLFNSVAIHSSLDASWETVPVRPIPGRPPVTDLDQHRGDYEQHSFDSFSADDAASSPANTDAGESTLGPATLTWADIDEDAILVDIRDDDEVASGMVPGAKHIPMEDLLADPGRLQLTTTTDSNGQIDSANRQESTRSPGIAVYCRSGVRSAKTGRARSGHRRDIDQRRLPRISVTAGTATALTTVRTEMGLTRAQSTQRRTISPAGERREDIDRVTIGQRHGPVGRGHGVDEEARARQHGRGLGVGRLGEGVHELFDGSGTDLRFSGSERLPGCGDEPNGGH